MQIRRFSPDMKSEVPGGHPGLYAVPIQYESARIPEERREQFAQRMNGLPILLNRPMAVLAMYLDAHASMDEHSAEQPILFLVTGGTGFVRIGGSNGETQKVTIGDAVLWPAHIDHMVWTEDEMLSAIVIEGPARTSYSRGIPLWVPWNWNGCSGGTIYHAHSIRSESSSNHSRSLATVPKRNMPRGVATAY